MFSEFMPKLYYEEFCIDLNKEKMDSMKNLFEMDLPVEYRYDKDIDINS